MSAPTIAPTPLSTSLTNLQTHLGTLQASGATGFEGLVRDLLEHITGMAFRLSKSGHQHGVDLRSQATNAIGLEAKKFLPDTRLQVDELKDKIYDALSQPEPIDVWILAATREITDNDKDALVALGDKHGLTVIIVDWTKSAAALPRMAVLCAAAPDVCANFLGNPPGLKAELTEIAAHFGFANKLAQLKQDFTAADAGFAAATVGLRRWTDEAQSNDSNAKSRLQGPNNLTEPNVVLVHRAGVSAALDHWWQDPANLIAALLGDEGNGKTWSALGWSRTLDPQTVMTLSSELLKQHPLPDPDRKLGVCAVFSDCQFDCRVRAQQSHSLPGAQLRRQLGRLLRAGHHLDRSRAQRPAVRALRQPETQRTTGYRCRF